MRPSKIESKKPVQLLVEGKDALNFFSAFAEHLTLTGIQIHDFGGGDDLRRFLAAFSALPDFDRVDGIGIVRDAEQRDEMSGIEPRRAKSAADSALQSTVDALRNARLPVPNGSVETRPVVSVLILPGNGQDGMLETLLCRTFEGSREDHCISTFFKVRRQTTGVAAARQGPGARVPDHQGTAARFGRRSGAKGLLGL